MATANFESAILPGELVVGDHNEELLTGRGAIPAGMSRGLEKRDWEKHPLCGAPYQAPLPASVQVPRDEWDERIEEMERTETRLSDLVRKAGLPCKDQNGTNYCWINAPVHCVEVMLIVQNQMDPDGKPWILSPASVGCKIKNFRNQGGWGGEGLEYIVEHGVVPVKLWPANAINRQYDTAAAWIEAGKFTVKEWYDLRANNFGDKMSAHFHRKPTADGYNWWSHEVTGYDPVIVGNSVRDAQRRHIEADCLRRGIDKELRDAALELAASKYGARERNSWSMSYGEQGFFILTESKATPSDCCSPNVVLAM